MSSLLTIGKKFHCFNDQNQEAPFCSKIKLQWDCITLLLSRSLAQDDSLSLTLLIGMICSNDNTLHQKSIPLSTAEF